MKQQETLDIKNKTPEQLNELLRLYTLRLEEAEFTHKRWEKMLNSNSFKKWSPRKIRRISSKLATEQLIIDELFKFIKGVNTELQNK